MCAGSYATLAIESFSREILALDDSYEYALRVGLVERLRSDVLAVR